MQRQVGRWFSFFGAVTVLFTVTSPARAAKPSVEQALKLKPIQSEVEYDTPTADEAKRCTLTAENVDEKKGWVVRDAAGQTLRRFVDMNNDNVVDLWCYFQDGIEVYRDVDSDFDGKADEYRWLNTAGTRWAIDKNADGKIDSWKQISAEEVSAEVVRALATGDAARFSRLLLTAPELKALGLGEEKAKQISKKVTGASKQFATLAKQQKVVKSDAKWVHFGATRPGVVPKGTDGSTRDVTVYEDVAVVVETGGKHEQLQIGTIIQVADLWRLVDVPSGLSTSSEQASDRGVFFHASLSAPTNIPNATDRGPSDELQKLLAELEEVDEAAAKATSASDQAKYHARRADLIQQIANSTSDAADRAQWIRQLADMLSAAAQSGEFPGGVERLEKLYAKLAKNDADKELAAYTRFRFLSADYGQSLQSENADFAKIQTAWLKDLEQYVKDYPESPDTAEAMLQLGIAEEFAGQDAPAKKWYAEIVKNFPNSQAAKKAAGAARRLDSVGQAIPLRGTTLDGKSFDLASLKGRVVLVHYWATWCEPCKADLATIKELIAKYGRSGFLAVGINLDNDRQTALAFLKQNRLPWPQLHEDGGLDSRLANEMGILTLPTMILLDKDGKVANRSVHVSQLETELKALLR